MSSFKVVELSFDPIDQTPSLEDEFTLKAVSNQIEKVQDIEELRQVSTTLLQIAIQRQAIMRGLCKRLAELETQGVNKKSYDG
tara:strand:- start:540 stop:788 length:249 start_codon:yes stop_codon:yes gene_type:complete